MDKPERKELGLEKNASFWRIELFTSILTSFIFYDFIYLFFLKYICELTKSFDIFSPFSKTVR